VRDRIFISKAYPVTAADIAAQPELAAVGVGGTVQYFTNSLDTSTKGIDFVGTYRTDLANGKLNLSLAYNYNKSEATKYDPAAIATYQLIDIQHLAPNHRATAFATWSVGNLGIDLRENYFGSWVDANDYPTTKDAAKNVLTGMGFGAKFTTDLDVNYRFMDRYTATIGASNLFNTYPDKIRSTQYTPVLTLTGGTPDGQVYPRNGGPFGINGTFLYANVRVQF
jgi:iron complex outermembrane receptor protein